MPLLTALKTGRCQEQFGLDERGKGRLNFLSREGREGGKVAERRDDNSPAFQCWVQFANVPSPGGTTGFFKTK